MNKKGFIIALFCLIISAMAFAQVPQKMSYQAVVRGSDNNLVTNSEVSVRVSILQGSVDGEAVYTETHSATTNANGLLTIEIGDGTSNDDFTAINWANGPFFVKTETDVNGGDDYDIIGVSQLLSVPYAMYAKTAGNVPDVSNFISEETDPTVPEWAKSETKPQYDYSEIQNTPEIPEFQALSISNDTIFLSDGGFVKLPPAAVGFSGDYNDLTNRPEIPTVPTNVSAFENDANYVVNEADPTVPAWAKAENKPVYNYSEIEGTPEIPTVPTNVSAFDNDANYVVNEADPTVPAWAKAENKPVYNYSEIEGTPEIPTVPTNVSAFENDANYVINEADPTVPAWAKANTKPVYNYSEIEGTPEIPTVPTNVSAFENDANYLQTESDPTVPTWAKTETKPSYSYEEITGKPELFSGNYNDLTNKPTIPTVPTSVSAFENDANYLQSEADPTVPAWAKANAKPVYDYSEITNTPAIPTVPTNVSAFTNDANYLTTETDPTVPAWAKANAKPVYDYSEITNTPAIPTVPTNVSAFTNDANYVVNEADPTVPSWAKANAKPVYDYSEITNTPAIPTVPTNVSAFTNDANYVVNEGDPTVPAWAKANTKPTYNYNEIQNAPTQVSAFENDANYISSESQTLADVVALGNSVNAQLKNVSAPTDNQDAATKEYVDEMFASVPAIPTNVSSFENDANYLQSESQTLADAAALGNSVNAQLKNVTDPTEDQDAATKKYVDDLIATLQAQNATLQAAIRALTTGTTNGHDWVDLGLPSGTKWATCNIGATNPEDYGDYFAWGETTTKTTYNSSTYTYSSNPTTLPSSDDAATANWGSAWRMPTKAEFEELYSNCTYEWTTQNGVSGEKFTGPNGNSIFLPAAGYRGGSSLYDAGSNGDYWSSSLRFSPTPSAWCLFFNSGNCYVDGYYRGSGQSVRAVCQSQN